MRLRCVGCGTDSVVSTLAANYCVRVQSISSATPRHCVAVASVTRLLSDAATD